MKIFITGAGGSIATGLVRSAVLDWPLADAGTEWSYDMSDYGLGSNSRVRAQRARQLQDWAPKHAAALEWIARDMG